MIRRCKPASAGRPHAALRCTASAVSSRSAAIRSSGCTALPMSSEKATPMPSSVALNQAAARAPAPRRRHHGMRRDHRRCSQRRGEHHIRLDGVSHGARRRRQRRRPARHGSSAAAPSPVNIASSAETQPEPHGQSPREASPSLRSPRWVLDDLACPTQQPADAPKRPTPSASAASPIKRVGTRLGVGPRQREARPSHRARHRRACRADAGTTPWC